MRQRAHFVGIWLDDQARRHLTQQTEATGLTASALIRKLVMGADIRPRPPDAYAALLRELSAIGNNVNQLAHWANAKGHVTQGEIRQAAELVRQAWQLIKDTL